MQALEEQRDRIITALRAYTAAMLADEEDDVLDAAEELRDAAGDFVLTAHDDHGGWPNVFADLLVDDDDEDNDDGMNGGGGDGIDSGEDGIVAVAGEVVAVRARYDVRILDLDALVTAAVDAGAEVTPERSVDALYELVHAGGTPFAALEDVDGIELLGGGYVFSTSPRPLTLRRIEDTPVAELIAPEPGTTELRSGYDTPMFPDRETAERHARDRVRRENLRG